MEDDKAVILSLDGTLSDNYWRLQRYELDEFNLDVYHTLGIYDKPLANTYKKLMAIMTEIYDTGCHLFVVTDRPYEHYEYTSAWMKFYDIFPHRYFMNACKSNQSYKKYKSKQLVYINNNFNVICSFDNDSDYEGLYKTLGIKVYRDK